VIVAKIDVIRELMTKGGLRDEDLASSAGLSINTIRNLLAGKHVSGATVAGLLRSFDGNGFDDLFDVEGADQVTDDDEKRAA
jgi:transcriptional regulator with XRE-family HTH domain